MADMSTGCLAGGASRFDLCSIVKGVEMARIVKVKFGDQEVDAIEADFTIGREEWNEYKLLDGGTVRLKTTVTRIYRAVDSDGQPRYNGDGSPMIAATHKSDVVASI